MPAGVPLAAVMPSLLRQVGEAGADGGANHGGWKLCTVDGTALDTAQSLDAAQIHDGALLFLRPVRDQIQPPLYDDVVEIIGEASVPRPWTAAHSRRVAGVVAMLSALIALAGLILAGPSGGHGLLAIGVAAVFLLVGAALSRAVGDVTAGALTAGMAAPWAAVGVADLLGGRWGRAHLLVGCAAILLVAALLVAMIGGGEEVAAGLAAFGLLGGVGMLAGYAADRAAATAAIAAALSLASLTLLPALSLRMARIPRPVLASTRDELSELAGEVDFAATTARVAQARRILTGLLIGALTVTTVSICVLGGTNDVSARVFAVVLILLVLLRARMFRDRLQVLIPLLASVAGVLGTWVVTVVGDSAADLLMVVVPSAAVVAIVCLVVALSAGRRTASPRTKRLVDGVETLLQVSVVPLVLAIWGVYGMLLSLAG